MDRLTHHQFLSRWRAAPVQFSYPRPGPAPASARGPHRASGRPAAEGPGPSADLHQTLLGSIPGEHFELSKDERRLSRLNLVRGGELRGPDPLSIQQGPIPAAEIPNEGFLTSRFNLQMTAGKSGVIDGYVGSFPPHHRPPSLERQLVFPGHGPDQNQVPAHWKCFVSAEVGHIGVVTY